MAITATIGIVLLVWTIASVGFAQLIGQLHLLGVILPFAIGLAALRFVLQAAGWLMVIPRDRRPGLIEATLAVIGGEAAGYLAWGPISREPVKALMIRRSTPECMSLAAAMVERLAFSGAATGLIVAGLVVLALRTHHVAWIWIGAAIAVLGAGFLVLGSGSWCWVPGSRTQNRAVAIAPKEIVALVGLATLQELTNVFEAYVILGWLGASPSLETVIAFEGLNRLANSAGQFIPGKIGVNEWAGAGLANLLRLGSAQGLTLALARRLRSLAWAGAGVALLALSAARRPSSMKNAAAA